MNVSLENNQVRLVNGKASVLIKQGSSIAITNDKEYSIDWPGEFEIGGITVRSFESGEGEISFQITADNVRLYFPGRETFENTEAEQQELGNIDVLFVATESSSWTAKDWKKLTEEIDPRLVIFPEHGEKTDLLLKEIGGGEVEKTKKKDIGSSNLPSDKTVYVILE